MIVRIIHRLRSRFPASRLRLGRWIWRTCDSRRSLSRTVLEDERGHYEEGRTGEDDPFRSSLPQLPGIHPTTLPAIERFCLHSWGRPHTFRYNLSSPLPSTLADCRGVAKHYRLEAQRKKSHDETTEPVSTDRRLVRSRSCVQTSDAASGRARPRAKKRWRSHLQRIGVDQARQRYYCTFSRGWARLAGADQRCAAAGNGLVIRRALRSSSSIDLAPTPPSPTHREFPLLARSGRAGACSLACAS